MTVVEEIVRVRSVDLVADPATTRSLFEGVAAGDETRDSDCRRMLESAGVSVEEVFVEALALLGDRAKRQAFVEALAAMSRGSSFAPRPRSSEPFWEASRPGTFPADAASFAKALR